MANTDLPRPGFDELVEQLRPIIFRAVPKTVSVGLTDEIVEDVVYMITHGKTLAMQGIRNVL